MKSVNLCAILFLIAATTVSASNCNKGCVATCMLVGDEDNCLKTCDCGIQRIPTLTEIAQQNACSSLCNLNCSLVLDQTEQLDCYRSCACSCHKVCLEGCVGAQDEAGCKASCGCIPSTKPIQTSQPTTQTQQPAATVPTPAEPVVPVSTSQEVQPKAVSLASSSPDLATQSKASAVFSTKSPVIAEMRNPQSAQSSAFGTLGENKFLETEVSSGNSKTTSCGTACVNQCVKTSKDQRIAIDCLSDCGCYEEFSSIEFMQAPEAVLLAHGTAGLYSYLLILALIVGFIAATGYVMYQKETKKGDYVEDDCSTEAPLYSRID